MWKLLGTHVSVKKTVSLVHFKWKSPSQNVLLFWTFQNLFSHRLKVFRSQAERCYESEKEKMKIRSLWMRVNGEGFDMTSVTNSFFFFVTIITGATLLLQHNFQTYFFLERLSDLVVFVYSFVGQNQQLPIIGLVWIESIGVKFLYFFFVRTSKPKQTEEPDDEDTFHWYQSETKEKIKKKSNTLTSIDLSNTRTFFSIRFFFPLRLLFNFLSSVLTALFFQLEAVDTFFTQFYIREEEEKLFWIETERNFYFRNGMSFSYVCSLVRTEKWG